MHTWLKRAVAGLLSAVTLLGGGLLTAGTANADEIRMPDIGKTITSLTTSAATTYPRELVNGDFEYPSMKSLQHYFTGIDRNRSQWISNGQGGDLAKWSDIPGGLDTTRFGWSSTQTQGAMSEQRANAVELQKATGETTQMGELCASQKGTAIYQDIATTPGTLYRIELDHASRYRIHLDQMQVMVGAPGHEQPVEMTRTSSNKYGDKIGEKSTTIATHSTNPFGNQSSKDDFSHYVGYYTIPAGQSVTRFTFRQVSGVNTTSGNLLDNIVFTQAYKLSYDKNSDEATGQTPNGTATVKPAKTSATGGVKNIADTNASLPDLLVNGDFEYLPDGGWKTVDAPSYMTNAYTSVDPNNGQYMRNAKHSDADLASWADWPGFDQSKFAWKTDQKGGHDQGGLKDRAEAVELQQDSMDGNTYAEMVASEPGRTIYQNLATIPGTLYKIRLKHTSLCKDNVDQMQVVINGTPIEMTRVAANGKAGDKVGEKSKTIGTRVTNENRWHHSDQWETYEGYYVIPDGQTTTRFGFKAVNYLDPTKGNLLDDVTFTRAYKLSYDKNASDATGKVPSDETADTVRQTKARTTETVKTVADENVRYGSLANGDFSYPSFSDIQENEQGTSADLRTFLKSDDGTLWDNMSVTDLSKYGKIGQIPGFDSSRFAWSSTENGSRVELQQDRNTKNTYAEIVAQQDNTSIYQNVSTGNGGVLYKIRLKHASRQSSHADKMQVLVGSDTDHATPVEMTRVTSNGHGDKVGGKSTTITTKVSNTDPRDHGSQWETYEGYYQVPEGQKNTVFMFKSLEGFKEVETLPGNNVGNLVDDIEFSRSYKLTYDKNASDATGKVPSNQRGKENAVEPAESKTTGNVKTVADNTSNLPDHLVNGTFDYRGNEIINENQRVYGDTTYLAIISAKTGVIGNPLHSKLDNWDSGKFGWKSNDATAGVDTVEVQRRNHTPYPTNAGNVWGEIAAAKRGKYIYQDIATTPGVVYRWSLKHASRNADQDDSMQVMIGEPGKTVAQQATRTTSNGSDKTGSVGTTITTHGTAQDGKWETYTGDYLATSTTTRFTFRSVRDSNGQGLDFTAEGNCVDDLSFDKAYKLSYDKNSSDATGSVPSSQYGKENTVQPAKSKTTGSVGLAADKTASGLTVHDLKKNDKGRVPSNSKADSTQPAAFKAPDAKAEAIASKANGTVRLAADGDTEPESGTTTDDRGILTDTIARQDDGTRQRTITRSDGSVRVETIATTGAVSGCQVYYPAGTRITLATAKIDSDCWDSSQISKTNRTFYGWSANTDANDRDVPVADTMDRNTLNANARTEIVMPARAKTVYALWAINPTLSYNVNAPQGSTAPGTPASQTVPYNTAAADKSGWAAGDTGKIPGYRFDGWYTAPNGGNKYDFNTPLTGNVTVYAHWVGNGYTVRFAGNGATGGGTPDQAFQYNIGQNLHRNGFTRDGYTFTGWKRADNQQAYGDGQWVTNLTTQPNGIVTMVAQWSANEAHIRYNPNPPAGKTTGGQGTPNWDGHTGDTPAIGGNGWTIDGYTFAGWTTSPDGGGTKYAPGASWTANGTLTLYAQWTPGEAGLTYDGNGATGGKTDPQNGVTDQKVNVRQNGFTRDGYTFVRWDTQADCRGKAVNPGDKWTLQGSSTLYACWTGNMQPLTYHGNGATGGNTAAQSGKTGDELTTNANGFTRDGYTFVEWNTKADGTGGHYGKGTNGVAKWTMLPAGNDLYAIWQANPANIRYRDDWGATGSTPDTTGVTGQDVTIARNGFTRPGYTFTGWARDRRTNPSLQPGGRYTLTPGTTTLWAQWKADPAHLIYNANTGSTSQTRRTDGVVDQTLTVIANPFTRTGYTFTGWNTQADGRGKAYTAGNGFRLVADPKSNPVNTSVLYAQWRINRVTLKFNPNGGTGGYPDITVDAFTTVTIPADAKEPKVQRPGFRFTGWAMKPTPGAGDTILSPGKGTVSMPDRGSITVYAQWAPAMTTLPFTGGNAQVPTIWLYAGFALMLIALGVMMPMLRMRMAATKRTGKHMPITGGKHAK